MNPAVDGGDVAAQPEADDDRQATRTLHVHHHHLVADHRTTLTSLSERLRSCTAARG